MTKKRVLIAGEPLELLGRLLPDIRYERRADGGVNVQFSTDVETGAAWQRAMERRAADFLSTDRCEPPESRFASAFAALIREVVTAHQASDT